MNYEAKWGVMVNASDQISKCADIMKAVSGQAAQIKNSLYLTGSPSVLQKIKSELQNCITSLDTCAARTAGMKNLLFDCANMYKVNERKLAGIAPQSKGYISNTSHSSEFTFMKDEGWFRKFLLNDLKSEGAVLSGERSDGMDLLGVGVGGSIAGSILGYKGKAENSAGWDFDAGEVGISSKGSIEGYLAKGEAKGNIGLLSGSVEGAVGAVGVSGEAKATLFTNGRFDPAFKMKADAEAKGITATAKTQLGTDDFNVHGEAEGNVGYAKANAGIALGLDGVSAKAEVGAAVFQGEVKSGFSLFGIKVDLSAEGEAFGVGAKAEFEVTQDSFEIGGKLSALLGLGLKLKISW